MDQGSIYGIIAIIVSIISGLITMINHKRCRSKCGSDKEIVVSLDVEDTTPQKKDLKINLPKIPESPISEEENSVKIKEGKN